MSGGPTIFCVRQPKLYRLSWRARQKGEKENAMNFDMSLIGFHLYFAAREPKKVVYAKDKIYVKSKQFVFLVI